MKKYIKYCLILTVFYACEFVDVDPTYKGISLSIFNHTDKRFEGKFYIGTISNSQFIATDSISVPKIKFGEVNLSDYFVNENRWKPNLDKIRSLGSRCYFKMKLIEGSNVREEMLRIRGTNDFFSLELPKENSFEGDIGLLIIGILNDRIRCKSAGIGD